MDWAMCPRRPVVPGPGGGAHGVAVLGVGARFSARLGGFHDVAIEAELETKNEGNKRWARHQQEHTHKLTRATNTFPEISTARGRTTSAWPSSRGASLPFEQILAVMLVQSEHLAAQLPLIGVVPQQGTRRRPPCSRTPRPVVLLLLGICGRPWLHCLQARSCLNSQSSSSALVCHGGFFQESRSPEHQELPQPKLWSHDGPPPQVSLMFFQLNLVVFVDFFTSSRHA